MVNTKSGQSGTNETRTNDSEKSRMIVKIRPRVRVKKRSSRIRVKEKPQSRTTTKKSFFKIPPPTDSSGYVKDSIRAHVEERVSSQESVIEKENISEIISLLEQARKRSLGSDEEEVVDKSDKNPEVIKVENKRSKRSYY
jgi:hypothetical protein